MKINEILSDEDIEDCIEGSSNIDMIREIIDKTQQDQLLDVDSFGDWFAYGIRGYIDQEEGSEEYNEAYENNEEWGRMIAENINALLMDRWMDG